MSAGLADALALATIAHSGQKYGDRPYIEHPIAVARLILDAYGPYEHLLIPALLHDTVEDTSLTIDEIAWQFSPNDAATVAAVTRNPGETYANFVTRAARHATGRIVKLADNAHNLSGLAQGDGRRRRYLRARRVLVAANGNDDPFAEFLGGICGPGIFEEYLTA